jgi:hypothetical protein
LPKKHGVGIIQPDGSTKRYLLPEGIRPLDLEMIDEEDEVLVILYTEGRKTRHYFKSRGVMGSVHKLKSKGFIETVKLGNNYSYDLTRFGYFAMKNRLI